MSPFIEAKVSEIAKHLTAEILGTPAAANLSKHPDSYLVQRNLIADAFKKLIRLMGIDMIHCATEHPFYKEAMQQAMDLRVIAMRGLPEDSTHRNDLEEAARKLEYMAQSFTCTANLASCELALKDLAAAASGCGISNLPRTPEIARLIEQLAIARAITTTNK